MTGYFSQLARHTGLGFEPGAALTASSPATEPAVAVQRPESAPPAPPHVEEITFTASPAPGEVAGNGEGLAGVASVGTNSLPDRDSAAACATDAWNPKQTESKDDVHPRSTAATAKRSIDPSPDTSWPESRIECTDSESETRNPRERSAEQQSPVSAPWVVQSDEWTGAERQPAPQKPIEITHQSAEIVESRSAAQDPQAHGRHAPRPDAKGSRQPQPTPPTEVRESADAIRDEHVEGETIVRSYLKEVRAWVAAPPEFDRRQPERQRDEHLLSAGRRDELALEPEVEPATPRPGRPEALEVQDLNLSIGTISIVIEEPKQTAPAVPP